MHLNTSFFSAVFLEVQTSCQISVRSHCPSSFHQANPPAAETPDWKETSPSYEALTEQFDCRLQQEAVLRSSSRNVCSLCEKLCDAGTDWLCFHLLKGSFCHVLLMEDVLSVCKLKKPALDEKCHDMTLI